MWFLEKKPKENFDLDSPVHFLNELETNGGGGWDQSGFLKGSNFLWSIGLDELWIYHFPGLIGLGVKQTINNNKKKQFSGAKSMILQ